MRHDPAIASIVIMLRELKMHGMAQAVAELAEQGAPAFDAAQPILSQLLKAETAEREVRSVAYQLKVARFPAYSKRPTAAVLRLSAQRGALISSANSPSSHALPMAASRRTSS